MRHFTNKEMTKNLGLALLKGNCQCKYEVQYLTIGAQRAGFIDLLPMSLNTADKYSGDRSFSRDVSAIVKSLCSGTSPHKIFSFAWKSC